MAAAVVYDGTVGGGTLFQGMKFFIIQRVPSRQRWVDLIDANGGEVVKLEKQADMIIVDPARKTSILPGSYSWKFIQDSVKNGELEDREVHRAWALAGTSRQAGASSATRKTRIPFTAADDKILAEFVTIAERRGQSVKGNLIYQELEKLYPRHTSQSWRDRWVKFHQDKPRPNVEPQLLHSKQQFDDSLDRPSTTAAIKATKSEPIAEQKPMKATFNAPAPGTPEPFTEADSEALSKVYHDIRNLNEALANDAWKVWADNNPQHTAQQWRDYWERVIRPLGTPDSAANQEGRDGEPAAKKPKLKAAVADILASSSHLFDEHRHASLSTHTEPETNKSPTNPVIEHAHEGHISIMHLPRGMDWEENTHPLPVSHIPLRRKSTSPLLGHNSTKRTGPSIGHAVNEYITDPLTRQDKSLTSPLRGRDLDEDITGPVVHRAVSESATDTLVRRDSDKDNTYSLVGGDDEIFTNPTEGNEMSEDEERQIAVKICEMAPETNSQRNARRLATRKDALIPVPSGTNISHMNDHQQARVVFVPQGPPNPTASNIDLRQLHRLQHLEALFNRHISLFAQQHGYEVTLRPAVRASTIRLMTLYQVVRFLGGTDAVEDEDKWPQVCEGLGFPVARFPEAPEALRIVYFEQLADFAEARDVWRAAVVASLGPGEDLTQEELDDFVGLDMQPAPRNEIPNTPEASTSYQQAKSSGVGAGEGEDEEPAIDDSQEDSNVEEIREYIDYHVSLGYKEEIVKAALTITTMDTENCVAVMEALTQTGEIPEGIPGVWTEADDAAVRDTGDVDGNKQVVRKHGTERYRVRHEFLSYADSLV